MVSPDSLLEKGVLEMKIQLALLGIGIIIIAGFFLITMENQTVGNNSFSNEKILVFKSANCGCCVGWIAELKKKGFEVEGVDTADMDAVKQEHNIPAIMESCHTAIVGDYFIEGHVPVEAIIKLLEEKPSIDGIALPRMPSGSPGMPGLKKEPFKIYSLTNGKAVLFTEV
jgi:hypothetical protein